MRLIWSMIIDRIFSKRSGVMSGFLTHYLIGIESRDKLSDNYIKTVISSHNHAFLIGLHGTDLLPFNMHSMSRRALTYRTNTQPSRNHEDAALFNNMLEYISTAQGHQRDVCISYMAGFLCFYAIDRAAAPYISYRVLQGNFLGGNSHKGNSRSEQALRTEIETTIDTVLLRSHCHMEPSQLNFEALTFISKKDAAAIGRMMQYAVYATYKKRISSSELASGVHNVRRQLVALHPDAKLRRAWVGTVRGKLPVRRLTVYRDLQADEQDYMNSSEKAWYPYAGSPMPLNKSFSDIYSDALRSSVSLLEELDSTLSWGMNREGLLNRIIQYNPSSV